MFPPEPLDDQPGTLRAKIRFQGLDPEGLVQAFRVGKSVEGGIPRGGLGGGVFREGQTREDLEETRGLFDGGEAGDAKFRNGIGIAALGVRRFSPL